VIEEINNGWQIIEGKKPILIVAGHNFEHGRDGKMKFAEWGTGVMVRRLCELVDGQGLVSTRKQMDPNWYFDSPFREEVREIILKNKITLVIDMHGSGMQNEELVYLRGNKKFREKYMINVKGFVKNKQLTLAEEWNESVPIVEIEVREDGRIPTINEENYKRAQEIVKNLVESLYES
jgi:hypothetical protein